MYPSTSWRWYIPNLYRLSMCDEPRKFEVTIVHLHPRAGESGFILQTQKYSPPIVGLSMHTTSFKRAEIQNKTGTHYALQISARLNAMNSMNREHI